MHLNAIEHGMWKRDSLLAAVDFPSVSYDFALLCIRLNPKPRKIADREACVTARRCSWDHITCEGLNLKELLIRHFKKRCFIKQSYMQYMHTYCIYSKQELTSYPQDKKKKEIFLLFIYFYQYFLGILLRMHILILTAKWRKISISPIL